MSGLKLLRPHPQPDCIVGCMNQILPRSKIPFGRLNWRVPQKHLDLLKLATGRSAQLGTSASEVVGRDAGDADLRSIPL